MAPALVFCTLQGGCPPRSARRKLSLRAAHRRYTPHSQQRVTRAAAPTRGRCSPPLTMHQTQSPRQATVSSSAPQAQETRFWRIPSSMSRHRGRARAAWASSSAATAPKRRGGVSVQTAGRVTRVSAAVMPTSKTAGRRQRRVAPRCRRHSRFCSNSAWAMSGSGGMASSPSGSGSGRVLGAASARRNLPTAANLARQRAARRARRA